ncbi:MAG TPA: hypothetical protein ENJ53_02170 [Phaeodactylibacter sp.]|nr:hypothetical protein [Phaeodactylibacter sp.]
MKRSGTISEAQRSATISGVKRSDTISEAQRSATISGVKRSASTPSETNTPLSLPYKIPYRYILF